METKLFWKRFKEEFNIFKENKVLTTGEKITYIYYRKKNSTIKSADLVAIGKLKEGTEVNDEHYDTVADFINEYSYTCRRAGDIKPKFKLGQTVKHTTDGKEAFYGTIVGVRDTGDSIRYYLSGNQTGSVQEIYLESTFAGQY